MSLASASRDPRRRGGRAAISFVRRSIGAHPTVWVLAAVLVGLGGASACEKKSPAGQPSPSASASASLAAVPAPAGLLAEVFIPHPSRMWGALRKTAGTSLRWFPATFPMAVGTLLGLPAHVVTLMSEDLPVVGALASASSRPLVGVVGIHVRSGREVVAVLTTGNAASHEAQPTTPGGLTVLSRKHPKGSGGTVLGVLGNYLLVGTSPSDLERLGPFVARTLPKRKMTASALSVVTPAAALEGPAAEWLERQWQAYRKTLERKDLKNRVAHGGRAPDFGDPAAALMGIDAVAKAVTQVLRSARAAELHLDVEPDGVSVLLQVSARKQGAAARLVEEMAVGDLGPLLSLPKSALVAVLTRTTARARESWAKSTGEGLQSLFGDRLKQKDRDFVQSTLGRLAVGRGDFATYALLHGRSGTSLVMQSALTDAEAFDAGARALFRLPKVRAFQEPIRQFVGEIRVTQDRLEVKGLEGKARRARLTVKPAPMRLSRGESSQVSLAPPPVEVLWWTRGQMVYGAAAVDAAPALVDVATSGGTKGGGLAADSWLAAVATRAGTEVSFSLVVQPIALGLPGDARASAPALLTIGRQKHAAVLKLDVHPAVVRALVQSRLEARAPSQ
jgi:hypothetical protein